MFAKSSTRTRVSFEVGIRELLSEILQDEGYRVSLAENAGEARNYRARTQPAMVLLDIWKDLYVPCLEAFYPKLSDEGVIAADNMIEPEMAREDVRKYRAAIRALPDMQTALLPIGSGIELSVRWPAGNPKL